MTYVVLLYFSLSASMWVAGAQDQEQTASLVLRFQKTHDPAGKERILGLIVQRGLGAGQQLLQTAKTTDDKDTRWLAIRGLGTLTFEEAAAFFIEFLKSEEHYVRANAARAWGALRYSRAGPALIHLLEADQDPGVVEQTSRALLMIKAKDAVPVTKLGATFMPRAGILSLFLMVPERSWP